jgi:hypothetical protein
MNVYPRAQFHFGDGYCVGNSAICGVRISLRNFQGFFKPAIVLGPDPFIGQPLLLGERPHFLSRPPQRSRKTSNDNTSQSSNSAAVRVERMSGATTVQMESDPQSEDEDWIFVKGLIGVIFFTLAYALAKLTRSGK